MCFVSVVIPNFNHALYLKQRIESVLNQTFQNFELIILDDCSTDNSKEVIERYKNHPKISKIVYNEENSGSVFRQWIKGIKLSTGKYIWIAESDDDSGPDVYSVKCKVNTDIYKYGGLKKMIFISEFEDNLIHHLPNLYMHGEIGRLKLRSENDKMQKALYSLLK